MDKVIIYKYGFHRVFAGVAGSAAVAAITIIWH